MRLIHLDTNLLINRPKFELLADQECAFRVSALAYAEFTEGLFSADPAVAARAALDLIDIKSTYGPGVPFGPKEVDIYRELCGAVARSGRRVSGVRRMDLMIAAVAVSDGAELGTRNVGDFRGIEQFLTVAEL